MATRRKPASKLAAPAEKLSDADAEKVVDAVQEEAKPAAKVSTSSGSVRPNDLPIGGKAPVNSTFAQRARTVGKNKRVDATDAASK